MKEDGVVFTPEAEEQIAELYRYIEENASPEVALHYTSAVDDGRVEIVGIFHGGRDYERALQPGESDD